jgi:hypothetical protein
MGNRFILLLGIFLLSVGAFAQPPETVYLGTAAVTGYDDDSMYGPFNIGFNFTFYGNSYSQFYINSNGQVLFGAGSLESLEAPIPSASAPNNFIAPFWDDQVVDSYGNIMYRMVGVAPSRKLIVQFTNMGFYPYPANMGTYSVILYETSNIIQIQYRLIVPPSSVKAHGNSAAIGIENSTGTSGIQFAYHDPAAIKTEQAISFTPSGPTYAYNADAIYDGVFLTTNIIVPEPGITTLISPPQGAVIGSDYTFQWGNSPNATSYTLYLGNDPELADAVIYPAGSNLTYDITGLTLNRTYYWGVFASNATGTTWCEIKNFSTSSSPPLAPVPQTVWTEQGQDKTIKLNYTGGDGSSKTARIMSLPANGQLFQYNAGLRGSPISSVPATVTDPSMNVIYYASGSSGNGVGSFGFQVSDAGGSSPTGTITVNVSPPGVPGVLYFAKNTGVEIQFDRTISDPTGKQGQFEVNVNGTSAAPASVGLKQGDPYTITLSLATPLTGSETVLVSYTQGDVTSTSGGFLFSFSDEPVTLTAQTINFPQSLARKFSDSPYVVTATSSSGLGLTYTSSNTAVATFSGSSLIFHALGTSVITLRQLGNASFAPVIYIKTLTVDKGDQVITFNTLPAKIVGDADFSPGATSSSGLSVTYSSSNTAVATIVSGNIHIIGAGSSDITASQAGNTIYNSATPVLRTLNVSEPASRTLSLSSVLLQGLYDSGGMMKQAFDDMGPHWTAGVADHITVELHSAANYSSIVFTASNVVLNTNGTAIVSVPSSNSGSYYITIKHRNSIETTTALPVSFSNTVISYAFDLPSKVYGNNLILLPGGGNHYAIYGGDSNGDGATDGLDLISVENAVTLFSTGYLLTDLNADGIVDAFDLIMAENNTIMFVCSILP